MICMYMTAFASISSTALEIEVLLVRMSIDSERINKKMFRFRTQIKYEVENLKPGRNPVWYRKQVFASEEYGCK